MLIYKLMLITAALAVRPVLALLRNVVLMRMEVEAWGALMQALILIIAVAAVILVEE